MMPPSKHAKVSPSKLKRIIECPASLQYATMEEQDNQQSVYASEGSHLHYATEQYQLKYMKDYVVDFDLHPVEADLVDPPLNKEQIMAVEDCIEYLGTVLQTVRGPSLEGYIEKEVTLQGYDQTLLECYGTCDVVLRTDKELHVIDWKFGAGIPVYAHLNDQLYAYALGAAQDTASLAAYDNIYIHVVQPRLNNFDCVTLQPEDLEHYLNKRLVPGITQAYQKHAKFNPGPEQCRWCPHKVKCVARYNRASETAADVFRSCAKLPDEVTIEEMTEIVRKLPLFEKYAKECKLYLQRLLEQGQEVPGYKVVHGRSLRRWADTSVAEEFLLDHFDMEDVYESKMTTPAKALKLTRDKELKKELETLMEKPPGKPTMVEESDKRQAIVYETAEQKFKDLI